MMDTRTRQRKKKEGDAEAIRIPGYSKAGRGKEVKEIQREGEKSKVMEHIVKT